MSGLIVHDWLEERGGAEVVVDAMLDAFPGAELFALWDDAGERFSARTTVHQSWLAGTPLRRHKAAALPFMPMVWRGVRVEDAPDWMLVSSNAFAHQARLRKHRGIPKYVYTHSPARYVWDPALDQRSTSRLVQAVRPAFRAMDRAAVDRSASFAANSEFVRERMLRAWNVQSRVIHPPVPVESIQRIGVWAESLSEPDRTRLDALPADFLLGVSRFVPYKRLDAVLEIGAAEGLPVVIAGAGPDEARLRALAADLGVSADFVIAPSTPLLRALYQRALALLFLSVEDFGIVPVEAMAAGAAVIVNCIGGAAETVEDGVSGAHVTPDDRSQIREVLDRLTRSDVGVRAAQRARSFGHGNFVQQMHDWVGASDTAGRGSGSCG